MISDDADPEIPTEAEVAAPGDAEKESQNAAAPSPRPAKKAASKASGSKSTGAKRTAAGTATSKTTASKTAASKTTASKTTAAKGGKASTSKKTASKTKAAGKKSQAAVVEPEPEPVHQQPAAPDPSTSPVVLEIEGLIKRFGDTVAVDGISLRVLEGSFYGIVGPNGAGKTTTLSMVTGLLRPDAGSVRVHGIDVWKDPVKAKRAVGVLPDRLRLFDRLTGAQLLYYSGALRGLGAQQIRARTADLAAAFGIEDALGRLVADYSAGMTKKIALAAAMIHSPRLLVLDEPFESVDPVSAANVIEILQKYVAAGGTVVLSSHGMDLIQRVCDSVAIIVNGAVPVAGSVADVRGKQTLEDRFVELAGGRRTAEGMEWLHSFSD